MHGFLGSSGDVGQTLVEGSNTMQAGAEQNLSDFWLQPRAVASSLAVSSNME